SVSNSLRERRSVFKAGINLLNAHYGYVPYAYIYGYCSSLLDKRDGFFEPVPPSLVKYALSLAYGSFQNPRHLLRFWKEWFEQGSPRLSARLAHAAALLRKR